MLSTASVQFHMKECSGPVIIDLTVLTSDYTNDTVLICYFARSL